LIISFAARAFGVDNKVGAAAKNQLGRQEKSKQKSDDDKKCKIMQKVYFSMNRRAASLGGAYLVE
jgi:hypothetical protein